MTGRERYRRMKSLYLEARDLEARERAGFLKAACGEDASLRREVEELLAFDSRAGPDAPPGGAARAVRAARQGLPRPHGRVGPYEIEGFLGRGGMGEVYRARDPRLDRLVALKFLGPVAGTGRPGTDAAERFLREARAASALDHPNVCTIHDFGVWRERSYLVMPCYRGETLRERLARGPLPVAEAREVGLQLARGLAAAHAQGIVHRDVKPSNVLLSDLGPVKILDFGLAVRADGDDPSRTGVPIGTPGYMAPEQLLRAETGPATDVWALGALLYESLTGNAPFAGDSLPAVFYATVYEEPPPLTEECPDAPAWLVSVVERCLRKDPARRFPDAGEVAEALGTFTVLAGLQGGRVTGSSEDLTELERSLSRRIASPGARSSGAYRAYVEGLHHASGSRLPEALDAFRRAVEDDPSFALPWAASARAYAYLAVTGGMAHDEAFPEARRAAERALELDPSSADAWTALGQVRFFRDGDLPGALAATGRALGLDPDNAFARYHRGALLVNADRPGAAIEELERALELDPLSPVPRMFLAFAHLRRHDYERAIAVSRANLELHPGSPLTRGTLWRGLWLAGKKRQALATLPPDDPRADLLANLAASRRAAAEEGVRELEGTGSAAPGVAERAQSASDLVFRWALLGDDRALGWMREVLEGPAGRFELFQVLRMPEIDFLRSDPRFLRLLREVGAPRSFGEVHPAAS